MSLSQILDGFLPYVFFLTLISIPLILTVLNIVNLFKEKPFKPDLVDGIIMTLGPILTVSLFSLLSTKDYNRAIERGSDISNWHTPLASWHLPTIVVLILLGLLSYIIIRKYQLKLPPLWIVLCMSCMMISCLIYVLWFIQLSPHIFDHGSNVEVIYLYIFPLNYIVCSFAIWKKVIKEYPIAEQEKIHRNLILQKCNHLLNNSRNWPAMAIILMIPLLAVLLSILVLFGQQPSAVIKAFTETSDWLLSQKTSPPPVTVNNHYLCTVALRGHPWLVKPLRYGIRHKTKIAVNRQLCVANAFEQIIQERIPKGHRVIRSVYDKYGYPLSKYIVHSAGADIIYLLMKPLEWFFIMVIYLVDKKPEDRIAVQYLPINTEPRLRASI